VVAALTFGVAAISFATSYGALYAYARDTGLYSDRLTRLWPLLLDGAFIVAQLAAILAGILRGSRGWPILTMLLTGALTVWFNLQHAGSDPGRRLAAALPPGADDAGLRDRHPDREMGHDRPRQAPGPHRSPTRRRHAAGGGLALGRAGLERSAPQPPRRLATRPPRRELGRPSRSGKLARRANPTAGAEGPGPAGMTKRQRIEAYLDRLAPEQLRNLTLREITSDLQGEGLEVTERYVKHILDQRRPTPTSRRRGSGPRSPRR
jgi:Protein of unknown function (DUF2637)